MRRTAIAIVASCWLFLNAGAFSQSQESFESLQKRAEAGDAKAQNEVGVRLRTGDGVEKDQVKALEWYRLAAKQGYATAYYNIGAAFYNGDGVIANENAACKWFLLAAEAGETSGKDGYEREKQDGQTHGGTNCMVLAGDAYLKGVEIPKDEAHALKMYRDSAEAGNSVADLRLFAVYSRGDGVEKDTAAAMHWLQEAADRKDKLGRFMLGRVYEIGQGVPVNLHEACENYKSAVAVGSTEGYVSLAALLENGRGVQQDLLEALRLYQFALVEGDTEARAAIDRVKAQLTKKQLQTIQGHFHRQMWVDEIACK